MRGVINILKEISIPRMYRIMYHIEGPKILPIEGDLKKKLNESPAFNRVQKGMKIAVTVGSRGISNQPLIVKTLIEELKKKSAEPFVIPAMGSHAGADAEGQKKMLEGLGFAEDYIGVPIKSSMEVVQIGVSPSGLPVYVDKNAYEADAVILVNRIKTHTAFVGPIESGLAKMSVIGLGKQKGAEICHDLGFEQMSERLIEIAHFTLAKLPILFGVGLIENGHHETAEIHVIAAEDIEKREPELLERANDMLARVPFKELESLIVDRIGKDISGTGLDPNVVGRYHTGIGSGGPSVSRISVLDITDASHGNGNGLGVSDFTTRRAFDKFDFAETYPNSLTSNVPVSVKIPMVLPNDKMAIQAAIKTCLIPDKADARVVRIRDTISLDEMEVSETLLREVEEHPLLEVIEGPYELPFDEEGNLF
jgi:hypothetical protein